MIMHEMVGCATHTRIHRLGRRCAEHTLHIGRRAAWCGAVVVLALVFSKDAAAQRLVLNLNPDWKFVKADPGGAQQPSFDDKGWANVSAPHTYNDIDTFDDWSIAGHRGEQNQWSGRTWHRKSLTPPESFQGKKVYLEFEAVRQVAEVYLNGRLLGVSKTGFAPFGFDLTPYLKFDGVNVLAVMCDNRFMVDEGVPVSRGS
jgi:beta-galactosidase